MDFLRTTRIVEVAKGNLRSQMTWPSPHRKWLNFEQLSHVLVHKHVYFYESTTSVLDDRILPYAYSHFVIARDQSLSLAGAVRHGFDFVARSFRWPC